MYKNIPNIVEEKFGKVSPRTRITSIDQLRKGDHVMEESPLGYWHHFIVEKVRSKYVLRIHKTGDNQTGKCAVSAGDLSSKARVIRDKFVLEPGMVVYRIEYPDKDTPDGNIVYSDYKVVKKARKRIGEKNYNAILSNCEHFFFGVIQDSISVAFLVIKADRAKDKGHVTPQDAERFKAKRVTPVVCGFVGYIMGALLGYYHVPLPLVGSLVGAFLGHFLWQLLGLMFGRWLATVL
ncbi:hypothetical protein AC249_AIPGENE2376 [Exaiptasia diaphana]|nr:hypothetical protein AC249_AIPGENE2376 [Exaiptasia diaphana]